MLNKLSDIINNKINFAIVGYGAIGHRHAALIQQIPNADLVAICDNQKVAHPDIPLYATINEMLKNHPEVDVVNVCSPNGLHATHAIEVLDAQRHVVIEKPMALSKSDCEAIIHKALSIDKKVFCIMQNRYSPVSAWLKQVVDNQLLGKILFVQANCFWNRDNRYYSTNGQPHFWRGKKALDGGPLFTQFAHFIDTLYWIFGDMQIEKSNLFYNDINTGVEVEDTGIVQLALKRHNATATFQYSIAAWDKNMESSVIILGSQGSIKISGQYMDTIAYCHIKDYDQPVLTHTDAWQNHFQAIENVALTLQQNASIATNAMEGMKVVEIIENIYHQAV